jgi:hypothetical protein
VTTRVVQWATGAVGAVQLQEVVDDPDLELVGVFVYGADKIGVDAGVLVGRAPVGVVTTGDRDAILALDADVVLHAASKGHAVNTNTDDIVALLDSGKDVITTTSYNHLRTFGPDAEERITAACARSGTRFHAAGEHPGFMFERLAATLTGLSKTIDSISVQEFVDCSVVPTREMLVDLMGMGKEPGEITVENPMFRAVSVQYEQAIHATADVLGVEIDRIETGIDTAVIDHDVELAVATIPSGTVVGQVLRWTGFRDGHPFLVAEEHWVVTDDIPQWDLSFGDAQLIRVVVEGLPRLRLDLTIDRVPVPGLPSSVAGHLVVGMTALRALPYVREAPPGVVTAPVFGAARRPRRTEPDGTAAPTL